MYNTDNNRNNYSEGDCDGDKELSQEVKDKDI